MRDMKQIIILLSVLILTGLYACTDLDIKPQNIVSDEYAFNSTEGVKAYYANVYRSLPIEDFNYSIAYGFDHPNGWQYKTVSGLTGEAICRDIGSSEYEGDYWDDFYKNIRRINHVIRYFPDYADNYDQNTFDHLLGEAYFLRAYMYYALVKRYGGVPYIKDIIDYPDCSLEGTYVRRDSEEDCWDNIAADLDTAMVKMGKAELNRGRANKYTAAALKSTAMLFAGCIAKYNESTHFDDNTKKQVCGISRDRATDYFQQSLDAAKMVEGHYSLYKKYWKAGDQNAQIENYIQLFLDETSPEIIFAKQYSYPDMAHSWDKFILNRQFVMDGIGSSGCPSLDYVEMFDGLPKTKDGKFKCFDDQGYYILYDDRYDPFANAEPRLRAQVLVPGEIFKDEIMDIMRGIYVLDCSNGKIPPLLDEEATDNYPSNKVASTGTFAPNTVYTFQDGTQMCPSGAAGVFSENAESAFTGFSLRKFLDPDMDASNAYEKNSTQQWIEIRYAEVMLNRAEAEYELYLEGQGNASMLQDAYIQINAIRERSGAILLNSVSDLTLDVIRRERRKELGFENKTYWDLRRWRILHKEQDNTKYRILMPFYAPTTGSATEGKWFYDAREDIYNHRFTFDQRRYYHPISTNEIMRNPNMIQNPGY